MTDSLMTDSILTPERLALVAKMAELAPKFADRAAEYDRTASFPYENWDDLRAAGFLGLCVPVEHGGLGADFVGYALVAEELGRHCATTALTFNMHSATALLVGQVASDVTDDESDRALLESRRAELFRGIVEDGLIHSQPFSEGVAPGATAGIGTMAIPVDGGYLVTGKKIFASLSGAANIHNIVAQVPGDPRTRLLGVPADADGVSIEGDWDPLGMRGTDSRNLVMHEVFVPESNEWIPAGTFDAAARRWPYFYMTLSFAFLGLMRSIRDFTGEYLRGEHGTPARRDNPVKQAGWAEINLAYDRAQALTYRVLSSAGVDTDDESIRRAWSAMVTTMEGAAETASLAIRVCGGRSMLRPNRLEQHYRDARCGATMLPWSVEVSIERLGRSGLYPDLDPEAPA
jgi:alkylation response protein AidB-like acyl-CoA dehydrogenase